MGKPEGKGQLGKPRNRWEDNIKIHLRVVECGGYGLDGAGSGYEQLAGTCECGNEHSCCIKFGECLDYLRND